VSVPVAPADRVEALDVLRGVALFGVLTVNLVTIFRLSLFQEFLHGPEDAWARAVSLGLEFKAVTLFSLLFGIGLEAQRERIDGFHRYILRRLVFLLVIGLVRRCSGYRPAPSWGSPSCSSGCRSHQWRIRRRLRRQLIFASTSKPRATCTDMGPSYKR
jgi:hypothetical protein